MFRELRESESGLDPDEADRIAVEVVEEMRDERRADARQRNGRQSA